MPLNIYRTKDCIDYANLADAELHEKVLASKVGDYFGRVCQNDDVRRALQNHHLGEGKSVLEQNGDWLVVRYSSHDNAKNKTAGIPVVMRGKLIDVLVYVAANGYFQYGGEFSRHDIREVGSWVEHIR